MDLKTLLGSKYKDGMTFAEIQDALADVDPTADMKKQRDKAASEAADYRKQLRDKQTEAEKADADRKAEFERISQELETLKAEKTLATNKARFLGLGFSDDDAAKAAKALSDGDLDAVFTAQKAFMDATVKAKETELLRGGYRPPAGGSAAQDYAALADKARESGDLVQEAYYRRMDAMNQAAQSK